MFKYKKIDGTEEIYPKGMPRSFKVGDISRIKVKKVISKEGNSTFKEIKNTLVENDFLEDYERTLSKIKKTFLIKERKEKLKESAKIIFKVERQKRLEEVLYDWKLQRHTLTLDPNKKLSENELKVKLQYLDVLRDMEDKTDFDLFNPQWPVKP